MNWNKRQLQYVSTVDYNNESRYILAGIDQKTFALTIRLDFSITPDLTVQFYGQPFISAVKPVTMRKRSYTASMKTGMEFMIIRCLSPILIFFSFVRILS